MPLNPLNTTHQSNAGLAELENLHQIIQNAKAAEITDEDLSHWAFSLGSALRTLRNQDGVNPLSSPSSPVRTSRGSSKNPGVAGSVLGLSSKSVITQKEREASTFPTVLDRNKKGPRILTHPLSQAAHQKIRHCAISILAVLESVLNQVHCDAISLAAPYRGHDYEFRCLCAISREKSSSEGGSGGKEGGGVGGDCMAFAGSGIIRGKNSVEYAAYSSGYIINTCPKGILLLGEDSQGDAECMSLMELMGDPYRRRTFLRGTTGHLRDSLTGNNSNTTSSGGGVGGNCRGPSVARLCCPAKSSASSTALGLVTVTLEGSIAFTAEAENYVFDAATTIGTLLARCRDLSSLQACFAKGNLRDELPAFTPKLVDIPNPRTQLVYRISNYASITPNLSGIAGKDESSAQQQQQHYLGTPHPFSHQPLELQGGSCASQQTTSVRLMNPETGKIEKLREGSPLKSVLGYMERLQLSWFAAVRLNVELKRKCETQERYLSVFLQQNRAASTSL